MFISFHEIEHSFSNKAQRLVYRRLRRRTKRRLRNTRSVADYSLVHSPVSQPPHFFTPLTIVKNNHFSATHLFSAHTVIFCTAMMTFDHDKILPPFVTLSTSPCCTCFSSQYDGTHYNDNAQHGTRYNSIERTTLPLPSESQRTRLSTVNVHNARLIDSAHFAQPMSHNSTYRSPSLVH